MTIILILFRNLFGLAWYHDDKVADGNENKECSDGKDSVVSNQVKDVRAQKGTNEPSNRLHSIVNGKSKEPMWWCVFKVD